jgi:hypothetical protein
MMRLTLHSDSPEWFTNEPPLALKVGSGEQKDPFP